MTLQRLRSSLLLLVLMLLFIGSGETGSAADSTEGIIFLTLTVTSDAVELTDWNSVPGKLKKPRVHQETSRLLYEGKDLLEWHPLVSGDPDSVFKADMTVRGRSVDERDAGDFEDHLVEWPA